MKIIYSEEYPTFLPNYVKVDGTITSMAFQPVKDESGLSVDLEKLSSFNQATLFRSDFRLLIINAGIIRHSINDGLDTIHYPTVENSAHSLITGDITKGKQKKLLSNSQEVIKEP
jgi:hypothetical protein